MKKFIINLLLIFMVLPVYAETSNDVDFKLLNKISNDPKIVEAIGLMKYSPAKEAYNNLLGENPTKKVIKVSFKNLSELNYRYANFDALGWLIRNQLYIYVNQKHKDAPPEALCALIAARTFNQDPYDSKNEEVYIWTLEAVEWDYFIQRDPALANSSVSLIRNRENKINQLFNKSNHDILSLEKTVRSNSSYSNLPNQSPGFEDNIFIIKMNALLNK